MSHHTKCCTLSARALLGLLCVSAGEGETGEHLGRAWDGRSEVRFILMSPPTRWQCFPPTSSALILWPHSETADVTTVLCQGVRRGSWRGLSAFNALSNYSTTHFKWSCAANMNVEVCNSETFTLRHPCPLIQTSANSFLQSLHKKFLHSDNWIYF